MDREHIRDSYLQVRQTTRDILGPLQGNEWLTQPMEEVSPPRWMFGHVTWMYDQNILRVHEPRYQPVNSDYSHLFNSYYMVHGKPYPRDRRGQQEKPSVAEVQDYAGIVDERVVHLIENADDRQWADVAELVTLGINHEQQHQELALSEIRAILFFNGRGRRYHNRVEGGDYPRAEAQFLSISGGTYTIGADPKDGFSFDVERPTRKVLLDWDFQMRNTLVTKGEFLEFMEDDGYDKWGVWLRDGYFLREKEGWKSPLYWREGHNGWEEFTLHGWQPITVDEPVTNVSLYEADAFAKWAGYRLSTKEEWEVASLVTRQDASKGNQFDSVAQSPLHPQAAQEGQGILQMFGDGWEWTSSRLTEHPLFEPYGKDIGEYHRPWMNGFPILKGAGNTTPRGHSRASYVNFWPAESRWYASPTIRLARTVSART